MSRINHNIGSMQAIHRLMVSQADLATSLERLSSGLRINRGKDDPAGLIASENLRSEISGINGALTNAVRGNNVISTAEGALNEVSSLLSDIRYLITTGANTGGMGDEELEANQLQIDSILESIDRISNTTQFNGKKLLNGSLEYALSNTAASALPDIQIYSARIPTDAYLPVVVEVTDSAEVGTLSYLLSETDTTAPTAIRVTGNYGSEVFSFASGTAVSAVAATINGFGEMLGVSAVASTTGSAMNFYSKNYGADQFVRVDDIGTGTFTMTSYEDYGLDVTAQVNGQSATADGLEITLRNNSLDAHFLLSAAFATQTTNTSEFEITGGGAMFQLSPTVSLQGQVSLGLLSMATGSLGNSTDGFLSSISKQGSNSIVNQKAVQAERIVDAAIRQVSVLRGRLGAFQKNTIETTISSLQIALENVTASESTIRDTDFAVETAEMTRSQILVQAGVTVLRTANASPQNVLALLGG